MGGVSYDGLRYEAVREVLDRTVPEGDRARVFEHLQEMELAALPVLNRAGRDADGG